MYEILTLTWSSYKFLNAFRAFSRGGKGVTPTGVKTCQVIPAPAKGFYFMNLEQLIDSIPEKRFFKQDNNSAGFCIRYSTKNQFWVAGYGTQKSLRGKYSGKGYSPIEAVLDFINNTN